LVAGVADVLAGESTANNIDGLEIVLPNFSNIFKPFGFWEMALQHFAAVWIDFHLPERLESSTLEAKINSTNPGEQTADGWIHAFAFFSFRLRFF
jgi:hypothetical protein